jgi:hypothetical protein
MIDSHLYNVKPLEYPQSVIPEQASKDGRRLDVSDAVRVFVGGRYSFYRQMSGFLRILNDQKVEQADADNILKMTHEIREDLRRRKEHIFLTIKNLREQSFPIPQDGGQSLVPEMHESFLEFAVSVLSMLAAKPFAIMYGPLKRHGLLTYLKEKEPG